MRRALARHAGWLALRGLGWLLMGPMVLAINAVRFWAARPLLGDAVSCATCGVAVSLLGLWVCGHCGYSFYGFYFARCEACGEIPPYLECGRCGASTMNPLG